ncbi:phosphonoacetate hydrolase [Anaerohalosphaera lusitana]|uniref:Phosphonoacetate hydrolase n=1 Tax=Anaerohalosphaera lusitana TaxID=1936003 RepID=A0A1U9NKB7_9BACT|nr:alkaline phosphatase family protein [Anaerohalosphaera lusitana]AQT68372.1 phosphonoacetate hydrolase [Anaerohalosphaera lusitana]
MKQKVLIIGLDGFTWTVADKLISLGAMPNIANLAENGCKGTATSVIPCETSPAWASFQTGCLPGKTGIFGFHRFDSGNNEIRLNSFSDIAVPSLWELLTDASKQVISINMPISSPAPEVNGVIIPGLLCPDLNPETVFPSSIYNDFIKPTNGSYKIVDSGGKGVGIQEMVSMATATEKCRAEVALKLMEKYDWDLLSIQIQSTDMLQHRFWYALDKDAEGFSEKAFEELVLFYSACDKFVGELVKSAGENTTVFVISDHGFCRASHSLAINAWLREEGYLTIQKKTSTWKLLKDRVPPIKAIARAYGKLFSSQQSRSTRDEELTHLRNLLDMDSTRAFCLGNLAGLVYLNGDVETRKKLAKDISDKLLERFGTDADLKLIESVKPGDEVYGEETTNYRIPDLVIEYCTGVQARLSPHDTRIVRSAIRNGLQGGTHAMDGFFIANGEAIEQGKSVNCRLVDIAPTALALLGKKIPKHMDGTVVTEILKEELQIEYTSVDHADKKVSNYKDEQQNTVEKQLRDLGYL